MGKPMNYDTFADDYAKTRTASAWVLEPLITETKSLPEDSSIMEVGCGTGNYIIALHEEFPQFHYFGFDISEGMLEIARSRNDKINFSKGNADEYFPYEDSKFDFEFMINVAHHLTALDTFFSESSRTLKPEGILILSADSEEFIKKRSAVKFFPEVLDVELGRFASMEDTNADAFRNGFELVDSHLYEVYLEITDTFIYKISKKSTSSLRLISDDCFQKGLQMLKDAQREGVKWYTNCFLIKYVIKK
jgi:ubiquinone/menaquinone biosynthesis C-methylase UbiE